MEIGTKFCIDDIQDRCQILPIEGCEGCKKYVTYKECEHCGVDSTCAAIGDDGLCMSCRIIEEED